MLVATLAIAGLPPLSGFFSKDEILSSAFASGHYGIWLVGLLGAALTAFYMFRLYLLCFRGESRLSHEAEHHLHESPRVMIIPLVVLAALSVVGGWVGLPFQEGGHAFARWLAPVMSAGGEHAAEGTISRPPPSGRSSFCRSGVAGLGIAMAFRSTDAPSKVRASSRSPIGCRRASHAGQQVLGGRAVRRDRGAVREVDLRAPWRFWDTKVVDGTVNAVAYTFEGMSALFRLFQTGLVGTYALFITLGVAALIAHFLRH
jgi:NADH-quinone oxidoreductase subunit L